MLLALLRQYVRPYRWLVAAVMTLRRPSAPRLAVPADRQRRDHRRRGRQGDTLRPDRATWNGDALAVTGLQVLGDRCCVLRVAHRHGVRRDLPRRCSTTSPPSRGETAGSGAPSLLTRDHQRRPADPGAGADDRHHAGVTAPIMCVGGSSWPSTRTPGCARLPLVSVLGAGGVQLLDHLADADLP